MSRVRRGAAALAVAATALLPAGPASAHPSYCTFSLTLTFSASFTATVTVSPPSVSASGTASASASGGVTCHIHLFGTWDGWCDNWVANGFVQDEGGAHPFSMVGNGYQWTSTGGAVGNGTMLPDTAGGESCLAEPGADKFLFTGQLAMV